MERLDKEHSYSETLEQPAATVEDYAVPGNTVCSRDGELIKLAGPDLRSLKFAQVSNCSD